MKWLFVVALSGCVASNSVVCGDGRLCPEGTACDQTHALCVAPDQLTVCSGLAEGAACTAGTITGTCTGGVCLPAVCGDHIVEAGEACDDGNNADGDGCSADCTSDETCGNHIIDAVKGELCDDGNLISHDGCSSTCGIETPRWIEHSLAPLARISAAIAYDSRRDRTVLFGGQNGGGSTPTFLDDTWEWNGGEWLLIPTTSSPQARSSAGIAYDAAHDATVMYGGTTGLLAVGDTWLWNGATWTSLDVPGPSARSSPAMAADAKRGRVVLFGGSGIDPATPFASPVAFAETWEWDGAAWTEVQTAHTPPARVLAAMTFDPKHGVIVLAGGNNALGAILADTWTYDGTDWTNVTPSGSVPAVEEAAMAYDVVGQRVILYGGSTGIEQSTTWAWNGTAWSMVTSVIPAARDGHVLAQSAGRLVMFGGDISGTQSSETWVFASGWTQLKEPGTLDSFGMVSDPVNARAILIGGITAHTPSIVRSANTLDLSQTGFSVRASAPPTARSNPCLTYDYAHRDVVLFGGNTGPNNGIANNETWIWDGAGWSQRTPAQSPPVRGLAACAFDGHGVTVFGGVDSAGDPVFADAWTWDGTTWSPAAAPPVTLYARTGATAAYDPIRKQMVLFGGFNQSLNTIFDDTWLYDGTTWTPAPVVFHPSPRFGATFTWNDARQRLTLIGGNGAFGGIIDSYEWDGEQWHTVTTPNAPAARTNHGAAASLDGGGVLIYGGTNLLQTNLIPYGDRWELRWEEDHPSERCKTTDTDGDGLIGCADPDCWWVCAPLCPPGTTCDPTAPKCGDGTCDASREDCQTCPADCTCTPVCGDGICDPGETGCPGDCP